MVLLIILGIFKWAIPASFLFIFSLFQTNINPIFTTNQCEKSPSSIRYWDSNPRPSDCNYYPKTTKQGHPPKHSTCSFNNKKPVQLHKWSSLSRTKVIRNRFEDLVSIFASAKVIKFIPVAEISDTLNQQQPYLPV